MRKVDPCREIQINRTGRDPVGRRVLRGLWLCFRRTIRRPVAERFEFRDRANDEKASLRRRPCAELFAFENSRRVVLDSIADNNFAADVHEIEHAAHGVAGCRVRCLLVATPQPAQRIEGRRFRRADKIELNDAFDIVIFLFRQAVRHGRIRFTQVVRNDKRAPPQRMQA